MLPRCWFQLVPGNLNHRNRTLRFLDVRTEPEARDTALLPELAGERDEAVLGREPGQAARDGGGRVHAGGDRHVQGRRHDPDGPDAGLLLLLPPVPRPLTLLRPWSW